MTTEKTIENMTIENMSFEEALKELETIVSKIDNNQETLCSAIENFEKAIKLKKHCEKKLNTAQLKVDQIIQEESGEYKVKKLDLE